MIAWGDLAPDGGRALPFVVDEGPEGAVVHARSTAPIGRVPRARLAAHARLVALRVERAGDRPVSSGGGP